MNAVEGTGRTTKRLIEAHAEIMGEAADDIAFLHSVLCQCGLPYRPTDLRRWERRQGRASLLVEAGEAIDPATGSFVPLGLPHGERPRLALIHLTTEALRTGSPEIEVEASLRGFAKSLGVDVNGPSLRMLRDQMTRLSVATVRLGVVGADGRAKQVQGHVVETLDLWSGDPAQRSLWPSTVTLGASYFTSVTQHAVPLDKRAVAALAGSAVALDAYAWLAQRLWRIEERNGQAVSWEALKAQFGPDYKREIDFRRRFQRTLQQVLAVYPTARVEVTDSGVQLWPSRPPVERPLMQIGGVDKPVG